MLKATLLKRLLRLSRNGKRDGVLTKPNGKLLVMMLNPESEYFHEHMQRDDSYFRRIKHTDLREIKNYISGFYEITKEEYFLGIREQQIFDPAEKRFASLYVMVGKKK